MKIHIDVDCTPEEARSFFGLPDVKPMQDALMQEIEDRMRTSLKAMDIDSMFKQWLPGGMGGFEKLQQNFWSQFMGGGKTDGEK